MFWGSNGFPFTEVFCVGNEWKMRVIFPCLGHLEGCPFCSPDNNFADSRRPFELTEPLENFVEFTAISLIVSRRSERAILHAFAVFSLVIKIRGVPDRRSSLTDLNQFLDLMKQMKTLARLRYVSPNAVFHGFINLRGRFLLKPKPFVSFCRFDVKNTSSLNKPSLSTEQTFRGGIFRAFQGQNKLSFYISGKTHLLELSGVDSRVNTFQPHLVHLYILEKTFPIYFHL